MAQIHDDAPRATRSRQWSKDRQTTLEILGVADPEIDRLAEYLASITPNGSPLRSAMAGRFIGFLTGRLEGEADKIVNPVLSGIAETFTDLVKAYACVLGHTPSKGALHALANLNKDWIAQFQKEARERITKASDMEAEEKRLEEEFKILCKMDSFLKASIVEPRKPSEEKHKTLRSDWDSLNTRLNHDLKLASDNFLPLFQKFNDRHEAYNAKDKK
jgi:hypothetical protein